MPNRKSNWQTRGLTAALTGMGTTWMAGVGVGGGVGSSAKSKVFRKRNCSATSSGDIPPQVSLFSFLLLWPFCPANSGKGGRDRFSTIVTADREAICRPPSRSKFLRSGDISTRRDSYEGGAAPANELYQPSAFTARPLRAVRAHIKLGFDG